MEKHIQIVRGKTTIEKDEDWKDISDTGFYLHTHIFNVFQLKWSSVCLFSPGVKFLEILLKRWSP